MNKTLNAISRDRSFITILFFGAVIVLIVLALIYMQQQSILNAMGKIEKRKAEVETQKILNPFFKTLNSTYDKEQNESLEILKLTEQIPLTPEEENELESLLKEKAQKNELVMKSFVPDIKTFFDDSKRVVVNISLLGNIVKYRDVIVDILRMPYLEGIQSIEMEREKDGEEIVLVLTLYFLKK